MNLAADDSEDRPVVGGGASKVRCFITRSVPLKNWLLAFGQDNLHCYHAAPEMDSECPLWWDRDAYTAADAARMWRELKSRSAPLIVMSGSPSADEAMQYFMEGARGYCHRYAVAEQLREIALVVDHGGIWMGREAMQRMMNRTLPLMGPSQIVARDELSADLTDREWQVALEVARGASNREIATKLAVSERTVKAHLSTVFDKLQLRDRVQLALHINKVDRR